MTASNQQCSLLVSSCDKYSDLWVPYFRVLRKYWPDCPFPVHLITEEKDANLDGVNSMKLGANLDWSSLVLKALNQIETPYVLFTLEDFFLRKPTNNSKILGLLDYMDTDGLNMLRLTPRPGPDTQVASRPFGKINDTAPYKVSTQAAFWKKDVLKGLLVSGESAWQFEANGTKRSQTLPGFVSVSQPALPYYHHVIERGKWFPWDYKKFKELDIGINPDARDVMSFKESSIWLTRKTLATIKNYF